MSAHLWVIDLTGDPDIFDNRTFVCAYRGFRASASDLELPNPYVGSRPEKDVWYDLYLAGELEKRH